MEIVAGLVIFIETLRPMVLHPRTWGDIEDGSLLERASGTDYVNLDNCLVQFCVQDLRDRYHYFAVHKELMRFMRR